jgi:hypothetical protein
MALNKIFNNAPSFGANDWVGRFRSGAQINGRPVALQQWRLTTGDPAVADAVAGLLGGTPGEWVTTSDEGIEVMTTSESLTVQLTSLESNFLLWGRGNQPIRACDGARQNDDAGTPCVCPPDIREHKEGARAGSACQPNIRAVFRLADLPDLGLFRFNSSSWQLAADANGLEAALAENGGESPATLTLTLVEYQTKTGKQVSFTRPVITLLTPAVAA